MKNENKTTKKIKHISLIEDIIFYLIIIPLIIVSAIIIWQRLVMPDKIPNIFGYKVFFVFDEKLDQSIKYGDLVFTHNIEPKNLEPNNLIAFSNNANQVTIHRIIEITEDDIGRKFEMQNSTNEVGDVKYIRDEQVEGIIIHRIPNVGLILYKIQEPQVFLTLIVIVMLIGLCVYYVAEKLDKRNMKKT